MSDWLELELAHHLAPAEAPDILWERVNRAAAAPLVTRPQRPAWLPIAAILTIMVGAGAMWMFAKAATFDLQHLAALKADGPMDLNSSDPREITEWARRQAGIDLSLSPSPSVCLKGARIIRDQGRQIAAISYQVEGRSASLLVAHASNSRNTPHGRSAWQTGREMYALAISETGRAEAACLICHSSL